MIAFVIATPLQLFNCMVIMKHHFPDKETDLFVLNIACDMHPVLIGKAGRNQIHDIFYLDDLCKKSSRLGICVDHLYTPLRFRRFLNEIKDREYTDFFTTWVGRSATWLYTKIWYKNRNIKLHFYEEGTGVYCKPLYQDYGNVKLMYKLLGYRCEADYVEDIFLYSPELYNGALPPVEIGSINPNDRISVISDPKLNLRQYSKRVIYLDNSLENTIYKKIDQMKILSDICLFTDKSNILVRTHPRTKKGIYIEKGYDEDNNGSFSWEEILLNHDFSDNILITICSTAAFTPKMIGNQEPRIMILNKMFLHDENEYTGDFEGFVDGIKKMYHEPMRIAEPRNRNEFLEILKGWLSNNGKNDS